MKGFRAPQLGFTRSCVILLVVLCFTLPTFATIRDVTTFGAVGDGKTDDTAAINAAKAAMGNGDELFFPCGATGIYKLTSGLVVNAQNVTIDGQTGCSAGPVKLIGSFSGGVLLKLGSGSTSSAAPLLASADELATSFQVNPSTVSGLSVGDLIWLQEGGVDPPTSPVACDISGCRGEIVQVAGVSSNNVTVTTALHFTYDVATNGATAAKLLGVVSHVNVHDLVLDGSGTVNTGLAFQNSDSAVATNITGQNFTGTAIQVSRGWNPTLNSITVTHAGGNGGGNGAAVALQVTGNAMVNKANLSDLNSTAFGFQFGPGGSGTFNGVTVDKSGGTLGRAVKTIAQSYSTWNDLTVSNAPAGYNGADFEYYSLHDTVNTCNFSANNTTGITTFGNFNDFLTLNNCKFNVGTNGALVAVSQALSGLGRRDTNLTISGGSFTGTSGYEVIQLGGDDAYIHDATIGPSTQGIAAIVSGLAGLCFNNNVFASGMKYSYASNGGTGNANNNSLNTPTVVGALPPGACGTASTSGPSLPAPPTGLTATVR